MASCHGGARNPLVWMTRSDRWAVPLVFFDRGLRRMFATRYDGRMQATQRRFRRDVFEHHARARGATTVAEQAARIGVSRGHLYKILNNQHAPGIKTLDRIETFLGVPIDQFYPRVESEAV